MSHVDDGELTAYADGAYPVEDPVALRISAHLSTCGNCRTRLEQNEDLRTRAAEILGFAAPASVQAPAFESLQAQAAARRNVPRTIPLAWAATIVLALGIGWFGRGAWQGAPLTMATSERAVEPTSAEVQPAAPAVLQGEAQNEAPRTSETAVRARPPQVAAADRVQTPAAAEADAAVGAAAGAVAAAPPPPPSVMAERAEAREEAMKMRADAADADYITAAEAERRGLDIPRIPELPIRSIALQEGSVIVHQTLPDGKLVHLMITKESAQLEAAAGRAPTAQRSAVQANRVAGASVVVRGQTITVTGDVQPDSLRALAERVR